MPNFDPDPGTILLLPEIQAGPQGAARNTGAKFVEYKVDASPIQPMFAYASEGGKANIYRLKRASDNSQWALKVFRPAFRSSAVAESCSHLSDLRVLPGLQAATRIVLSPADAVVRDNPDLAWAVLMPWVSGRTWFEMVAKVQKKEIGMPATHEAVDMAQTFVNVMISLESYQIAHTDISSGNVTVASPARSPHTNGSHTQQVRADIQLIDLEDMWRPSWEVTTHYTPGYGHPSLLHGGTTACAEGDRYASTILVAEMLLLSDPHAAREFTADGYFRGDHNDRDACARYETAQQRLKVIAPKFTGALEQAWCSRSLAECAAMGSLLDTLKMPERHAIFGAVPVPAAEISGKVPTGLLFDLPGGKSDKHPVAPSPQSWDLNGTFGKFAQFLYKGAVTIMDFVVDAWNKLISYRSK